MNETELRRVIVEELDNVAPGAGAESVNPKDDIRTALDIDSMDFLNFITALHTKLKVEIPEVDYPKLVTVAGAIEYLAAKVPA